MEMIKEKIIDQIEQPGLEGEAEVKRCWRVALDSCDRLLNTLKGTLERHRGIPEGKDDAFDKLWQELHFFFVEFLFKNLVRIYQGNEAELEQFRKGIPFLLTYKEDGFETWYTSTIHGQTREDERLKLYLHFDKDGTAERYFDGVRRNLKNPVYKRFLEVMVLAQELEALILASVVHNEKTFYTLVRALIKSYSISQVKNKNFKPCEESVCQEGGGGCMCRLKGETSEVHGRELFWSLREDVNCESNFELVIDDFATLAREMPETVTRVMAVYRLAVDAGIVSADTDRCSLFKLPIWEKRGKFYVLRQEPGEDGDLVDLANDLMVGKGGEGRIFLKDIEQQRAKYEILFEILGLRRRIENLQEEELLDNMLVFCDVTEDLVEDVWKARRNGNKLMSSTNLRAEVFEDIVREVEDVSEKDDILFEMIGLAKKIFAACGIKRTDKDNAW